MMSVLNVDRSGVGPLFEFSGADRAALLTAGTTFYQTASDQAAITAYFGTASLTVAGTLVSEFCGITANSTDGTVSLSVLASGVFSAPLAFQDLGGGTVRITNAGELYGDINVPFATAVIKNTGTMIGSTSLATSGTVTNAGTIIGNISLSFYADSLVNTGEIIGDINLGNGNDRIDTHLGEVTGVIQGGYGDDTYVIAGTEAVTDIGGIDTVLSYGDYRVGTGIENLVLLGYATIGTGDTFNNVIQGNDRGNTLFGSGGQDTLYGGAGSDKLNGGDGNDYVVSGEGGIDTLSGANGNDTLSVSSEAATLAGGAGDDIFYVAGSGEYLLSGGSGRDRVNYFVNDAPLVVDLTAQTISGGAADDDRIYGIEDFEGSSYGDRITGSADTNLLLGDAGNDTLSGLGGADTLYGLADADVLIGGVGADLLDGGDGYDAADYSTAAAAISASLTNGKGTVGDALNDIFVSIEELRGSAFNDTLIGGTGNDGLVGGAGADSLNGAAGNDTLTGGAGNDTLVGGSGSDVFAFTAPGQGTDTITLLTNGQDRISLVGTGITAFSQLSVAQSGANTTVSVAGVLSIVIQGFQATNLDATDFIFA